MMLKTLLLFTFSILVLGQEETEKKCQGLYFNNKYYEIDIVKEGINNIHKMLLNRNENILYFTFDQITTTPSTGVAFLDIVNRNSSIIEGLHNASGIAIDHSRNRVYIGAQDGVYYITDNKVPEKFPISDSIMTLFFKDNILYFINTRRMAFQFDHGRIEPIRALQDIEVDDMIIDDDDNILFTQDRKLFRVKLGTRAINIHERVIVTAMSTDQYYKPYIATPNGVYVYNKYKFALDKLSNIPNIRALTFTKNDEPIYCLLDYIIRLKMDYFVQCRPN